MHTRALLCVLLVGGLPGIYTQDGQMFSWGFSGKQAVSTSLPSCRTLRIEASPITAYGIPPFYMMAFAVGGAPITTYIGRNASELSWTATHPIGTQLLLCVVDSQGNSGGVDRRIYTVIAGASTNCILPTAVEPEFTITADVTDSLTSCQPWGLTIQGGTPPYSITLLTPEVTNVTLSPTDSVFTYINRAHPDTLLLAAASDLNGRWAIGSPIVRTQGSAKVDCTGLVSTSSNALPDTQGSTPTVAPAHPISRARIATIAGVSAGGLLLVCGLIAWALQRRRGLQRGHDGSSSIVPFRTFSSDDPRSDMGRRGYLPAMHVHRSKIAAQVGSRHTILLPAIELTALTSHSSASPSASLPQIGELPPPYAHLGPYQGGLS